MEWQFVVALAVATPIILLPLAFIWYLNIGGIYAAVRRRGAVREREARRARAPAGMGGLGRLVLGVLAFGVPLGLYAFLIWFFLASFGWAMALAVALAIPIILVPVAFVWFLNISGLYQVLRDARRRQRVRATALREAEALVQGRAGVGMARE